MAFEIGDVVYWMTSDSGFEGIISGLPYNTPNYTVVFYTDPKKPLERVHYVARYSEASLVLKHKKKRKTPEITDKAEWE